MSAIPEVHAIQKVLLFDVNHRRREIRAANLRTRGVDVVCAKSLLEVRDLWHVDTFRLVLLETSECPDAVIFSREVRTDDPDQKLAFFVGKPEYLSRLPMSVDDPVIVPEGVSLADAFKAITNRNGFVEASLRMQLLRSSRRGATTVRPAKDPWAAMRALSGAN